MKIKETLYKCNGCEDTILSMTSRNVDDREVKIQVSAMALYRDWMGACDLCPANDAELLKLEIMSEQGEALAVDPSELTFEMLMAAVAERWPEIVRTAQIGAEAL